LRNQQIFQFGFFTKEDAMKCKISIVTVLSVLFTALSLPIPLAAQHARYKLIDLGTFGGPTSYIAPTVNGGPENPGRGLTSHGVIVGQANTADLDPFSPGCPFCFVVHAFKWQNGALTDLGTLQGVDSDLSSDANWINDRGWIAGSSFTGGIDPLTGFAGNHAVLWKSGEIIDLGTLGEDFSLATALNNRGQVVGLSLNGVSDPAPTFFSAPSSETRAFLWEDGVMQDLGTLGGLDAQAFAINESGKVAGVSSTNTTPNATTGIPTVHPFLWEGGRMIDLGSLGGTNSAVDGPAIVLNNRGQVAGTSTLEGDATYHPFFWSNGVMTDVRTLGGDTGFVTWMNDAGAIVGTADLPGESGSQSHHAFLWRNGVMTDLGTLGATSHAEGINSAGQIVGRSKPTPDSPVQHAFLWENGGPMVDLNTLIPANSSLLLEEGGNINDRGEIAGRGVPPGCDDVDACGHAFMLIPCDSDASCENEGVLAPATTIQQPAAIMKTRSTVSPGTRSQIVSTWRTQSAQHHAAP